MVYTFNNTEVIIHVITNNGKPHITLVDSEDGIPYARATVNVPGLNEDEIGIKSYAENEGILEFLVKNNIVSPTGRILRSGYAEIPVCKLNPREQWVKGNKLFQTIN